MQIHEIGNKEMLYFFSKIPALGLASMHRILERCPNLNSILTLSLEQMKAMLGMDEKKLLAIQVAIGYFEEIMEEYQRMHYAGIAFLTSKEKDFPRSLCQIPQAPMYLYQKGGSNNDVRHYVAIVGSRNASNYGREMTKYISSNLAKRGIGVVSGMALGIDAAAHRAALDAGGTTVAVLGCGVDICYPRENFHLYRTLSESGNGRILSEYPPGTMPLAFHFPLRNRIISGLADIVIVVEAKERSGSLITVDHALEQGKTVYAVPGRVTDVLSKGCNALIESGANVFTNVDDMLEQLCTYPKSGFDIDISEKNINMLANNEKMVYSCVDLEPKYIDQIVNEVGLSYGEVYTALLELELQGLISQISRNYYGKQL